MPGRALPLRDLRARAVQPCGARAEAGSAPAAVSPQTAAASPRAVELPLESDSNSEEDRPQRPGILLCVALSGRKTYSIVSVQSGERMSLPTHTSKTGTAPAHLERRIGLRSAVLFNMLEMIGV